MSIDRAQIDAALATIIDPNTGRDLMASKSVRNVIVPQLESFYVTELARQVALELRRG